MTGAEARSLAVEQVAAVASAIVRLGGAATAVDLGAATGLPPGVVRRRLAGNGPSMLTVELRYFTRRADMWGLTGHGRELVSRGGRPLGSG